MIFRHTLRSCEEALDDFHCRDLSLEPLTLSENYCLLFLESTWSDFCTDSWSDCAISCDSFFMGPVRLDMERGTNL